jgi:ABC-type bacteriocin/lantibiotic exporter with double-glycine peptidase domain
MESDTHRSRKLDHAAHLLETLVSERRISSPAAETALKHVGCLSVMSIKQRTDTDCGPTVLYAIATHYGIRADRAELDRMCNPDPDEGTVHEVLVSVAEKIGLRAEQASNATVSDIEHWVDLGVPVIVDYIVKETLLPEDLVRHLPLGFERRRLFEHYSIVVGYDEKDIFILDVRSGKEVRYSKSKFEREWTEGKLDHEPDQDRWMVVFLPK